MAGAPTILLPVTMDTKHVEANYVVEVLKDVGVKVLIMDTGIMGEALSTVDINRHDVARAGGRTLDEIRNLRPEGVALSAITAGAIEIARQLYKEGKIDGIIGIGGSMGTTVTASVMRALPFGFPKVMISTMAPHAGPYIGTKDLFMLNSVVDVSGLNRLTKTVFRNGAMAMAGMVKNNHAQSAAEKPLILLTTLGTTEGTAKSVQRVMEEKGDELIIFHSNGMGGQAVEELVTDQKIAALVDLSLHEIMDHNFGGHYDAGPERGSAALRKGVPTILVPGNTDFLVAGPLDIAEKELPGRRYHKHNETITCVRTFPEELEFLGKRVAALANNASGPVAILVPLKGFSVLDSAEGPQYDPEGAPAFVKGVKAELKPEKTLKLIDCHILDAQFAAEIVKTLGEIAGL